MRVLKFAYVDYVKTSRYNYLLLMFPLIALAMLLASESASAPFGVAYCLFAGIVLAAFPYNMTSESERGFLQMLPAKPGEAVLGHYLFGLLMILAAFLSGVAAILIARLISPDMGLLRIGERDISGAYPALLGASLLFAGVQDLLLTALRLENAHLAHLLRIVPAFVFFFGVNAGIDSVKEMPDLTIGPGLAVLGICLALYVLLAVISRAVSVRRGD